MAAGRRQLEILQNDMASPLEGHERTLEQRQHNLGALQGLGWPQVEDTRSPVDAVLARRVEFLENIEEIDPLPGLEAVDAMGWAGLDVA